MTSPMTRTRDGAARTAVEVRMEGLTSARPRRRAQPPRPDPGARRACRAARPVGLRQDHYPAPAGRSDYLSSFSSSLSLPDFPDPITATSSSHPIRTI